MSLSDYLIDTSALLHDTSFLLTSQFLLTRYINQARDQVARDSGCLRALIAGNAPVGTGATPGAAVPGELASVWEAFVEEMKRSGFVAEAVKRHNQDVTLAPPAGS